MHVIAAKAVALGEALQPAFASYAAAVVENAQVLAGTLAQAELAIVSGGTDTHLMLVDMRPLGLTGRDAELSLEKAGITCNKNGIPFDPEKPTVTSGIRLGSPAATSRGFGADEFRTIGQLIVEVLRAQSRGRADNGAAEARVREEVRPNSAVISRSTGRAWRRVGRGGEKECAVRFAEPTIPRSKIRGRPTIAAPSGGGASARIARLGSRLSNGCSCVI